MNTLRPWTYKRISKGFRWFFPLLHGLTTVVLRLIHEFCSALRKACTCFLPSLGWAMVLLGVFMSMGALILATLLQDYVLDESVAQVDREWIWSRRSARTWDEISHRVEIKLKSNETK